MDDPGGDVPANLSDDVTDTGVFQTVLDGYDAVYEALPQSKVFSDICGSRNRPAPRSSALTPRHPV
jgi:hypothetical protein